jgi:two-component system CheB/CheR fusion protein
VADKQDQSTPEVIDQPTHYVGIGASAGGLEAIENLFVGMPIDTGMAFIVVQHLSPDHKSLMVELLSKRTRMRVKRAENNEQIAADTIYLIPPKRNLTIFHGRILLQEQQHTAGINLPIDIFLRSLAEDQEDRAVGIILSGTGSDGVHGIRAVKESGGLVMIQDPATAKFDGMPNSAISTGIADFVLDPRDMASTLASYGKHPYATRSQAVAPPVPEEGEWLPRILARLRQDKKLDFTYYKPSTVVRRVQRRMTINQIQDPDDYVRYLESVPKEVDSLYRDLLIGVTNFFRNPEAFSLLRSRYLPELLRNASGREVRFWVAGCSTGEEAYTLAILVREIERDQGLRAAVKIFATDVDGEALYTAGNGIFPESSAADLSRELLARYFVRQPDGFKVNRNLREMVVFARHNLIKDPPFTRIDLVSCRNLLIYLQPSLQRKVLEKFNFSLNSGGLLMLGNSETIGDLDSHFETLEGQAKIYRSRGKTLVPMPRMEMPQFDAARRAFERDGWRNEADRREGPPRLIERVLSEAAAEYLPVTLIVNQQQEILHTIGDVGDLFRLPSGKIANDVIKMAHADLAIPLSTALQRALQRGEEVVYNNVRLQVRDEVQVYSLRIRPLSSARHYEPLAAIFLLPQTPTEPASPQGAESYDLDREAQQRILDLEQELQFSRENLQATIEELETSNEELQATNEELMASNEELQSTNEELQSVNEELFTVNAEYQKKITELTEITNDLDNLLTATKIGTVFLDENLDVRKFTPQIADVMNLRMNDVGRPVSDVTHRLGNFDVMAALRHVVSTGEPLRDEVRNDDGVWYLTQVLPYRVSTHEVSGVVMTFVDISRLKQAESARDDSDENYRLLVESVPSGVALYEAMGADSPDFVCLDVNPAFEEITGLARNDLVGRSISDIAPVRCDLFGWREVGEQVVQTGKPAHIDCACNDDERHCHLFAYRIDRNRLVTIVAPQSADGDGKPDSVFPTAT